MCVCGGGGCITAACSTEVPPIRMWDSHQTLSRRRGAFHQDQSAESTSAWLIIHDNKLCNSPTADFSSGCITDLISIQ